MISEKRILVVEDDASIRESIVDILSLEGFTVCENENGKQALENIGVFDPDIVISDVMMPEMNGHTLLAEYRNMEDARDIPFIFLTALSDRDDFRNGMKIGADDYLTKPFSHTELLEAIHVQLEKFDKRRRKMKGEFEQIVSQKLTNAEKEKETIIVELHDRVKNNLATISAFFELGNPEEGEQYIEKIKDRVFALASVHEEAYSNDTLTNVAVKNMILRILGKVQTETDISLDADIEEYDLDISRAIPFGLLIFEMLYVLTRIQASDEKESAICIRSKHSDGEVELSVITKNTTPILLDELRERADIILLEGLVSQLNGSIYSRQTSNREAMYRVSFDL
jgi:DNA-binding response OmpR family regulator